MRKIREELSFRVPAELSGSRIDYFLSKSYPELSRTYISKLIKEGYVFLNGQRVRKPSSKVKEGDPVLLCVPEPESLEVKPQGIPLEIVYEDEDILVLIKPCGLVVHPSPGYTTGTLVNALLYHVKNLSSIGGVERPGIVHRLDKDTAGLMVVAKNDEAHRSLVSQFQERKTEKLYMALVKGIPAQKYALIDSPIGRHPVDRKRFAVRQKQSKKAITEFWLEETFKSVGVSLLKLKIHTGRTHQIRVHLSSLGLPILGDITYGFKRSSIPKQINLMLEDCNMLVAYRLGFYHPAGGKWLSFEIEPPSPFKEVLDYLRTWKGSR